MLAAAKAMEQAVRKPTPGPSAASGSSPLVAGPAPADTPGPAAPIDEPLRKDHPDFPDAVTMEEEMGFAVHASAYDYGRRERGYDFLDQWKLLSTSIIVLAAFFPAVMAWDSLDIETREKLLSWAPNAQATLANRFLSCCKPRSSPIPPRKPTTLSPSIPSLCLVFHPDRKVLHGERVHAHQDLQ